LRPRRRDDDIGQPFAAGAGERVADLPQRSLFLVVVDFEIRYCGAELRIPVDEPLAAIDEAVLEELDESLEHGAGEAFVHREALARPAAGQSEPPHLVGDRRSGFLLPAPDSLDELRAAEIVARPPLGAQLVLDDDLRSDTGVIGAELP